MGENLMSYYSKRRFEKAKERIAKGLSITNVSEKMGYKSIHAFSRAFKNYVGMTPTDYRKWVEENKKAKRTKEIYDEESSMQLRENCQQKSS